MDDAFIQYQVEDALKNTRLLRNDDIKIETRNGEVILFGFVDVLAEKWTAGEAVAKVPGVVSVDNSLTVVIDNQLEDNEIAELVEDNLMSDPRAVLHKLTVTVKDGVVYLQGDVDTLAEEQGAKELAARVQNVKDVVSYLHLSASDFATDDASITNAVELALSRTTLVSVRDVETITSNGIVTLRGTVDTPEQIEAAKRIAAQVPGAKGIRVELGTRHDSHNKDYRLTNAIRQELGDNGLGGVKCFVEGGMAFLNGAVGTPEQKIKAEELVGRFKEIDGISNDIQIS